MSEVLWAVKDIGPISVFYMWIFSFIHLLKRLSFHHCIFLPLLLSRQAILELSTHLTGFSHWQVTALKMFFSPNKKHFLAEKRLLWKWSCIHETWSKWCMSLTHSFSGGLVGVNTEYSKNLKCSRTYIWNHFKVCWCWCCFDLHRSHQWKDFKNLCHECYMVNNDWNKAIDYIEYSKFGKVKLWKNRP